MHTQACQEACQIRHNDNFVPYPATAKQLMRDRRGQVVDIGHCYSNIIEDAQHHFQIHFHSEVLHNVFQAATREGLSHLQMPTCLDKAIWRISIWSFAKQHKTECCTLHRVKCTGLLLSRVETQAHTCDIVQLTSSRSLEAGCSEMPWQLTMLGCIILDDTAIFETACMVVDP